MERRIREQQNDVSFSHHRYLPLGNYRE